MRSTFYGNSTGANNSILTNADIWVGLTSEEIKQFENLDLILLRKFLKTPFSVPAEAVYLELG